MTGYNPEGIRRLPKERYWVTLHVAGMAPMYHCVSNPAYAETLAAAWKDRGLLFVEVELLEK